jgi:hypothetical protein
MNKYLFYYLFIFFIFYLFFVYSKYEYMKTDVLYSDIYTFTPNINLTTVSQIAQLWWQPISYIRNY